MFVKGTLALANSEKKPNIVHNNKERWQTIVETRDKENEFNNAQNRSSEIFHYFVH